MKLRCPYCKELFADKIPIACPKCGKSMKVPEKLQKIPYRFRKKKKERMAREAERELETLQRKSPDLSRKPIYVAIALFLLLGTGGLLLTKTKSGHQAPANDKTWLAKAGKDMAIMTIALNRYRADCGCYPTTQEGLAALILNPGNTNWGGKYINNIRADPWRSSYQYRLKDDAPKLWSCGPDGVDATGDEVFPADTNTINIINETVHPFGVYND